MSELGGGGSATSLQDAKRELLARLLAQEALVSAPTGIAPRSPDEATPLTHAQEVLWLLDQATPGLIAYNSALAFRLRGSLDLSTLQRALDQLAERHETLRTRFVVRGEHPVQVVDAPRPVAFVLHDLRGQPEAARE